MVEAVVAVPACLCGLAIWPGVAGLGLAGTVGFLRGLLRFRPPAPQLRPRIPLLLLLEDAAWTARELQQALKRQAGTEVA